MQIIPRLVFNGNCKEAIEFYKTALGATVDCLITYGSVGAGEIDQQDLIMNAQITAKGNHIQLADRLPFDVFSGDQISFLAVVEDPAQVKACFTALSAGGKVIMAPTATFFSPSHCTFTDKFGITWQINCPKE